MATNIAETFAQRLKSLLLSVPVRWKIIGIGSLPVVILGLTLNYWVTVSLSDWLSYILTDVRVEAAMQAGSRSVVFVTILAAIFSIFLSLFFTTLLTSPLLELKKTAEEVASGKFQTRVKVWANDEIGAMARSINQMIDNFVRIQDDLSRTNQQLAAINRIALAADQENEIHDVLYIALTNILQLADLKTGWIYLFDPELNKYHLASWTGVPPELESILLHEAADDLCACQRRLVDQDLGEQVTVLTCQRLRACAGLGPVNSHVTVPIVARDIHFGMLNLLLPDGRHLDEETHALLSSIGAQISEIVANAWLQIKLREKEDVRQLLLESLVNAQEDERLRLARELHDQTGQVLTNLLIRLKTIENKTGEAETRSALKNTLDIVSGTIDQIRDLSYSLRPPALEEFGLGAAVEDLIADTAKQARLDVKCECQVENDLPPEIAVVLYRILQEGMTNVVRHAQASRVMVQLKKESNMLYMRIDDDGMGFDPGKITVHEGQRHLGLISMSERAKLIGGHFEISSALGEGTTLEVFLPVPTLEPQ